MRPVLDAIPESDAIDVIGMFDYTKEVFGWQRLSIKKHRRRGKAVSPRTITAASKRAWANVVANPVDEFLAALTTRLLRISPPSYGTPEKVIRKINNVNMRKKHKLVHFETRLNNEVIGMIELH